MSAVKGTDTYDSTIFLKGDSVSELFCLLPCRDGFWQPPRARMNPITNKLTKRFLMAKTLELSQK
ncbi:MAG: hypothetical protein Kow00127_05910 [Bacteroidales bacterium]